MPFGTIPAAVIIDRRAGSRPGAAMVQIESDFPEIGKNETIFASWKHA